MYTKCKICSGLIKKKQGNLGICNGCRKKIIESESKEKDKIMLKNKHIANKLEKKQRNKEILDLYLLTETKTMAEIGKKFNLTRERIRQILTRGVGKEELNRLKKIKRDSIPVKVYVNICPVCGNEFFRRLKNIKYCSKECSHNSYYATEEERTEGRRLSQNRGTRKWQANNKKKSVASNRRWYKEHKEEVAKKHKDIYYADLEGSRKKSREAGRKYRRTKKLAKINDEKRS